jgi:hypothetical protein
MDKIPVPGYEGIAAGSDGTLWTLWRGRRRRRLSGEYARMHSYPSVAGYLRVAVTEGGKHKTVKVSRLVCTAFHGPPPDGMFCLHNDGNKLNNSAGNLRWGTPADNSRDRDLHGTTAHNRGEKAGGVKLSSEDVLQMRLLYDAGKTQEELADKYGVRQPSVSRILSGVRWGHLHGVV